MGTVHDYWCIILMLPYDLYLLNLLIKISAIVVLDALKHMGINKIFQHSVKHSLLKKMLPNELSH